MRGAQRDGYLTGVPDISELDLHWLAGLMEGEACFVTPSSGAPCRIYIQMTDRDVIERVATLLNRKVGLSHPPSHKAKGWKPCYRVVVNGRAARTWMLRVRPLMGERRRAKIDEIIEFYDHNCLKNQKTPLSGLSGV